MKIRKPAVAGLFYPAEKEKLIELIEWSFKHELGPGSLPQGEPTRERMIIAAQVPHAGYIYSGPAASHVYFSLYYDGKPETIVLIGPNHNGIGPGVSIYKGDAWETPLGIVEIDKEFVEALLNHSNVFEEDELAHIKEHSIEVQIPFLQYIYGNDFKIVPISVWDQGLETAKKIAKAIYEAAMDLGKDIILLASSDMSHYDPHEETVEKDREAIIRIEQLDDKGLYDVIYEKNITMCGYGPVATAINLVKGIGGKAFTLKYYTSGDISGDKSAVVGYAAIIFTRKMNMGPNDVGREAEALPL